MKIIKIFCLVLIYSRFFSVYGQMVGNELFLKNRGVNAQNLVQSGEKYIIQGFQNEFGCINLISLNKDGRIVTDTLLCSYNFAPLTSGAFTGYGTDFIMSGQIEGYNAIKYVQRLDNNFNLKWTTNIYNEDKLNPYTENVIKPDSNIIIVSTKYSNWGQDNVMVITELNGSGNIVVQKEYPEINEFICEASILLNRRLYVLGYLYNVSNSSQMLVFDENYNHIITKNYTHQGATYMSPCQMINADSTNIFLLHTIYIADQQQGIPKITLLKIDRNGEILWEKDFSWPINYIDARNMIATHDSNFILLGSFSDISPNYTDYLLLKIDSSGNTLWSKKFGTDFLDSPVSIIQDKKDNSFKILSNVNISETGQGELYFFQLDEFGNKDTLQPFYRSDTGIYWNNRGKWIDINKDGFFDLFSDHKIYLNQGGFDLRLHQDLNEFLGSTGYSSSFADCDNDGDLDLLMASNNQYRFNNVFFKNSGNFFIPDTLSSLASEPVYNFASSWADVNNDGYLDILQINDKSYNLFLNDGTGSFYLKSPMVFNNDIITNNGSFLKPNFKWLYYDNDNKIDLMIANEKYGSREFFKSYLFRNTAEGEFENITSNSILPKEASPHYYDFLWEDLNNDNAFDFVFFTFIDHYWMPEKVFLKSGDHYIDTLFDPNFDIAIAGSFIDYENDGDLDFLIKYDDYEERFNLYRNDITHFTNLWYHPISMTGYGDFSWKDYNYDGFYDLEEMVSNYFRYVYFNEGNSNNWIKIRLKGKTSNYDGIGAIVKIKVSDDIIHGWQSRFLSSITDEMNDLTVHFGLKNSSEIDSILIEWPSGCHQVITGENRINQEITIEESCCGDPPSPIETMVCFGDSVLLLPDKGNKFNWYHTLHELNHFLKEISSKSIMYQTILSYGSQIPIPLLKAEEYRLN